MNNTDIKQQSDKKSEKLHVKITTIKKSSKSGTTWPQIHIHSTQFQQHNNTQTHCTASVERQWSLGMWMLVLVLKDSIRTNVSLHVQSLSLTPSPRKVLTWPFCYRVRSSPASAENSYNHLRCLQRCLELNVFTAKSH